MEEKKVESATKEKYVPPKVLATYTKKDLEQIMQRSTLHGGCGACTGCGSVQES
jgi:hypothetical protein